MYVRETDTSQRGEAWHARTSAEISLWRKDTGRDNWIELELATPLR